LLTFLIKYKLGLLHQQLAQGPGDLAKILDKLLVKSCMAQKRMNLFHCTWGWKIGNQIHLHFVNLNPSMRYDVFQHNALLHYEMALLPIKLKVLFFASHQDQREMVQTFLKR
jgi:hypothetical protein